MDSYHIDRLGHRGDGLTRERIRVRRALPGETVEGTPEEGLIAAPRILDPAPERVRPACPHYGGCGGCALLHASDAFVADWKRDVVARALAAQGIRAQIGDPITSPPASRRRATLSGRRTKKGAVVGFHGRGTEVLTSVPNCRVLTPGLIAGLPAMEALTVAGASRRGPLSLSVTQTRGGLDLAVTGGKPLDAALRAELAAIAGAGIFARLTWDTEPVILAQRPAVSLDGIDIVPPPGAFLQATVPGEAALRAVVTRILGPAARIVDLFAGCGTFALPLARVGDVHAVEGEAALLEALSRGWRDAHGLRKVSTETRDLFRRPLLGDELAGFDAAVIDPPRAGAEAQTRQLAASTISRIAFVSCNPVTFARDAACLIEAGFAMGQVEVVDQFRWSPHVELVAGFTR
ncbi:class I SAM-dependent RNA methyltransferase [Profundibacterium mesophilum]|uniref:23S rRNA -methyltransferase RumA n=1 Tax=Profundibacterium mesophilum KAUST100406-0324 TaxID=1037889 RepID=A0A921NVN5_9RHOB|nr:class I SAM-dependent RNA methyltransferase [Profundibacterium mesophilum]KAF0676345.1 23S rRNA -methyltransferase RumA [Profundibacterium mesophilum KAUST100406-0324]